MENISKEGHFSIKSKTNSFKVFRYYSLIIKYIEGPRKYRISKTE